jgi:hypothetical protein
MCGSSDAEQFGGPAWVLIGLVCHQVDSTRMPSQQTNLGAAEPPTVPGRRGRELLEHKKLRLTC